MNQIIYVLLAAAALYFLGGILLKTAGALSSASFRVGGLNVPVVPGILVCGLIALAVLTLFDAFDMKVIAFSALIVIEAIAFFSLENEEAGTGSAFLWILKAFTLGGLFIVALTMFAA
ncbi:hypothetical protein AYO08_21860 [Pseudomonas putida]|uniref:hypothetical protein n=1 Tax=Pseudomonas putida TaxID=303 RepID=UPI0007DC3FF0|nr:hypothetical protein [Pseudomonas putida]OAS27571.1 hypothetical protein AYO08_21860 [Pseudomonas putida]QNV69370.1 hypothetical protein F7661_28020 [Pseudomonas sp. CFA]